MIELSNGILCPSHDSFLNLQCLENTADLWQVKWQTFSHKDMSELESNQALRGTVILKHVLRPLSHWGFFVTDKYRTFILSCRFAMESKKMPNIFFLRDVHTFHGFFLAFQWKSTDFTWTWTYVHRISTMGYNSIIFFF